MIVCFTASRLMKVSEVRRLCQEMRENPALLMATELKAKEEVYKLLRQQEKKASAPTLAIISNQPVQSQYSIFPLPFTRRA